MPNIKAAVKHVRQTKKRAARNFSITHNLKSVVKVARKALASGDNAKASEAVKKAIQTLDKAAQGKYIKRNTASRLKSRLGHQLHALTKRT